MKDIKTKKKNKDSIAGVGMRKGLEGKKLAEDLITSFLYNIKTKM